MPAAKRKSDEGPRDPEASMKEAAEMLNNAALALKRRRCLVAVDEVPGFVRTVYTLLRVCDPEIIAWSDDGAQIVIKASERFATEICPKFFRHRNFNSFTRLLNMYQFHKVPSSRREAKDICFEHPHFQRGREDLLPLVQRKGAQLMREELMAREWSASAAALEHVLQPVHHDPNGWMARMTDLENQVRALKHENDRLKTLEIERAALQNQLRNQADLISALQAQSTILPPFAHATNDAASSEDDSKDGIDPPPDDLNDLVSQMGGPVNAMAMIFGVLGTPFATPPPLSDTLPLHHQQQQFVVPDDADSSSASSTSSASNSSSAPPAPVGLVDPAAAAAAAKKPRAAAAVAST